MISDCQMRELTQIKSIIFVGLIIISYIHAHACSLSLDYTGILSLINLSCCQEINFEENVCDRVILKRK